MSLFKQFINAIAKKDASGCETNYVSETDKLKMATDALREIKYKGFGASDERILEIQSIAHDALKAIE